MRWRSRSNPLSSLMVGAAALAVLATAGHANPGDPGETVSFYRQVRPILLANCQGCHQPAKPQGGYVMTDFGRLVAGGESGLAAIVPKKPGESHLVAQVTPAEGKAEMPKGKAPLSEHDIKLIEQWIAQGAADDTPANARARFDLEHPPVYTRPPVITSLDFSPDGTLLAVAGFHEVLLVKPDSGELAARLVGLSERIQSVRFSPDGKRLAATGGLPARSGEVQVWDVDERKLALSVPLTSDTVNGASWSPDGKLIAFGCADNTVRAIDASTGHQVLQMGSHTDWVLGTAFSVDGSHLVSVGRDMTAKLTEVATQRFVDNVTSITPGALKGGVQAVAIHPARDEIVAGGSDGTPKTYRIFRQTARRIGDDANLIRNYPAMKGRVFSVAISWDGKRIAAGSALDGAGQVSLLPYEEQDPKVQARIKAIESKRERERSPQEKTELDSLRSAQPAQVVQIDVPQAGVYAVAFRPDGKVVAAAGSDGVVRLIDAGDGRIVRELSPAPGRTPAVASSARAGKPAVDFIRDVSPVLARLGCNQGTCHGAAQGKNGFKLSLRGYDPILDVRALTDDLASRRVNLASPDDSLMLLKPTGAAPHVGSQLIQPNDPYYATLRGWIAEGAKLDLASPRVAKIEISPRDPVVGKPEETQQFRVLATYANGTTRDVTREAFIETGNAEVATAAPVGGLLTAVRRGEAPVLARFEGAYTATILTVMGDRTGFVWQDPPTWGPIDVLVAAKWRRMKIQPSDLCSDAEFIRRISLDLVGLPPTAGEVRSFLADPRQTRVKRDDLVDRLLSSPGYVEMWTNKWADLLQVNSKFLGREGATSFREWIRNAVARNAPYDEFVHQILTASGSNRENPAASYYKILRQPGEIAENTTHLFLGIRFNCTKCHDHPFERWTQDQYYQTAAFFARVGLKTDPASGDRKIGGTAVEGAKPLYEEVFESGAGEVLHQRTGVEAPPRFPFEAGYEAPLGSSRRQQLAGWMTSPENPYFARSLVNRLWGYLFGRGIIEPIDDIRAGNPPSNPDLLDHLTREFVESDFDIQHVLRLICKSRTYQLSLAANRWNEDDRINFSRALPRRLPAEVLLDAIYRVTGSVPKFPGVPAGTRAAALPDVGIDLADGFLATLGRPPRESACECERTNSLQLGPVMALINGQTVADALADPGNELARLVQANSNEAELVEEMFLRILNRPPAEPEIKASLETMRQIDTDHLALLASLKERETYWASVKPKLENERETAIAQAKEELAAYEKELAPKLAELERQRAERIKAAEAALKEYDAALPAHLAEWEKKRASSIEWIPLEAQQLAATDDGKLIPLGDRSILATGKNDKGVYSIKVRTSLRGITGIRLEALPHEKLPGGGPGRSKDGNFVLNELTLDAAPQSNPKQLAKVELQKPAADFTQPNFDPAQLLDGAIAQNNGWAVGGGTGVVHWVTLETKEAIGFEGGTLLSFTLHQRFSQPGFMLGRFRISVTTDKAPIGLSLPEDLKAVLTLPTAQRDADQQAALVRYFRTADEGLRKRQQELAENKKPLPEDPQLVARRNHLAEVSKPLADDPLLVQLRQDAEMSTKQLASKRLTGAQDLAWALINSTEFLFNK